MLLAGIFGALHIGKLPPALVPIREELGFSLIEAGYVLSMFSLLGMTLSVFLGGMADRLGRKRLVICGFASLALGGAIAALSDGLGLMLVSRAFEGLGFISVCVALPSAISAAASERDKSLVLGLWSVYTPLGMSIAMFAAPVMLGSLGWRGTWWIIVAACPVVALGVLWALAQVELPRVVRINPVKLALAGLSTTGFLVIALTFLAYVFQWMTLMVWLPTFLTESLGLGLAQASFATASVVFLNAAGCLIGGWCLRRGASARSQIYLGTAVMGLCSVGILLSVLPDGARIGLACLFSLAGGLIPPALFNMVPRVAPRVALVGAGNGMLLQGSAIAQFIGAPLVAFAVSHAGGAWSAALAPMLAACVLTLFAGWLLGHVSNVRPRSGSEPVAAHVDGVPPEARDRCPPNWP